MASQYPAAWPGRPLRSAAGALQLPVNRPKQRFYTGRAPLTRRSRALLSGTPPMVIPGYTGHVKTAISLPGDSYEQATRQAAALGISRSEFFARAARSYLDELAAA